LSALDVDKAFSALNFLGEPFRVGSQKSSQQNIKLVSKIFTKNMKINA
jgi:hypothetical protein